jgi:uncharacterized low-complexity protein
MKRNRPPLKLATGMTVAASFAIGSLAHAGDNPFAMQKLDGAYQLAQAKADGKKADGKCGEAKCGAAKAAPEKKKDGNCGGDKKKDAACGADKKKDAACGADKKKDAACGAKK